MLFHRLTDSWHFCWLSRHGKSNTTAPRRSFGYGGLDLQRHFYCDSTNVSFQYQSKEILKDLQSKRVFRMPSIGESFIPKPMLDTKLQHSYFQMCLYNDTIKGSNLLTIIIADGFALNLPDLSILLLVVLLHLVLVGTKWVRILETKTSFTFNSTDLSKCVPSRQSLQPHGLRLGPSFSGRTYQYHPQESHWFHQHFRFQNNWVSLHLPYRLVLLKSTIRSYQNTCNPAVTGFHPPCVLV